MAALRCRTTSGCLSAILLAALSSSGLALGAEDTEAPKLLALRFSPDSIKTATGAAEVTITLTATDDSSGVTYIEAAFVDPSGSLHRNGSARFAPTLSTTSSLNITFPRFSIAGAWTLSHVFLSDAAGNTLVLDADGLRDRGFPTRLEVLSAQDTVSPKLTALDFAPTQIDTSVGPAVVKVNYTATDDLSGVTYIELSFLGPSGSVRQGGSAKLQDLPSISSSITVTFPRLSEPGSWTLGPVFLADAAGNTLVLDADGVAALGFRRTLEVKSAVDLVRPSLAAFRFEPEEIDTSRGSATVKVEFTATDNLSGVRSFEVTFVSPSGSAKQNRSVVFSPAHEVTDSVRVNFPKSSEPGIWTVGLIALSDAAGNTLVLDAEALASTGTKKLHVR